MSANRTQGPLSGVVIHGDATVFQEQAECGPAAQAITESSRQIALARNAGQLRFGPDAECFDLCFAVLLTGSKADIGRLTCRSHGASAIGPASLRALAHGPSG